VFAETFTDEYDAWVWTELPAPAEDQRGNGWTAPFGAIDFR
jgi:hypothetical protein